MKKQLLGILLAGALLASCSRGRGGEASAVPAAAPVNVAIAEAEVRDLADRIELTGSIAPYEQVTVYAKASGYLKLIRVDIGDWVNSGYLLAELEIPEMVTELERKRAALLKAEAAVAEARAKVEELQAEVNYQELNHKRLKAIHDRDADLIPEHDLDQARGALGVAQGKLGSARAQVKVAQADVASARADLETLETLMQYARIVAPVSGVVAERFVDPGALIQAASSSRTQAAPVVTVARMDRVRILVDVPEPNAGQVRSGTPVVVRTVALPGESFPGRVTRIGTVLDPGSRTMRAEIDMPNPKHRLRPGMTARVEVQLTALPGAVVAPVASLRMQDGERVVFRVVGGRAVRTPVRTGIESADWIQIVEGLRGGERVVVSSSEPLRDGMEVRAQ